MSRPDEDRVRWCPECEEPHIGGCPWAELEKRADPTVPMPPPAPTVRDQVAEKIRDDMEALAATVRRSFAAIVATLLAAAFGVFFFGMLQYDTMAALEQAQRNVETMRQIDRKMAEIELNIDRIEALDEAARDVAIDAQREAEAQRMRIHELTDKPR